ncbi:hypothetical protein G3578_15650 [Brevibacillus sp. SYP-B805]|uniref:hypothetical protein n=1 Tax=Brevibacillus sp. SYP-B805 TaxID=1578199 RepID=UPI0013EC8D80|nr:hypothetical protein [Brevibacillus sp. SYP-B805]NGQ96597.1 hypothetical protein [Brevibacillus sp. SYP-B805]
MKNSDQTALLINEGYLASTSLNHGLTSLRKASLQFKGEYYQAFFQLSIGLERLMKLIILQEHMGKYKKFPDNKSLRVFGHNLIQLYERIMELTNEYNIEISSIDNISVKILKLLSEFAVSSRYYNLDNLTGKKQGYNPLGQWRIIQNQITLKYFSNKKKKTVTKKSQIFYQILDDVSFTLVYDENNNVIHKVSELMINIEYAEKVQGYAVYHVYVVIKVLAQLLTEIEYKYHLYPCLREFFEHFTLKDYTLTEIVRKKRWDFIF